MQRKHLVQPALFTMKCLWTCEVVTSVILYFETTFLKGANKMI